MVRLREKCDKNDAELPHLRDFLGLGIAPAMPACYHTPGFGGGHFVGCFPFAITSMFSGGYPVCPGHPGISGSCPRPSVASTHVSADKPLASGVAGRYATALFELADQAGALDTVAADLKGLSGLIDTSDDLKRLVRSPVFSTDDQAAAMSAILTKAGVQTLTQNFIGVVIANRRIFALQDMIRAYGQLLAQSRGEISADVTSAYPLGDPQVAALKEALNAAMGRDVQIETRVDKELLGGLVVKVGSRMIDSSLRTKLNNLKFAMKEAG